jgi:hypothetical protein
MTMRTRLAVLIIVLALASLAGVAPAQGDGGYELWGTVDGGGSTSEGGGFVLSGDIGQPDAGESSGEEPIGGDVFTLSGGFSESRALIVEHGIYLPVVLKNRP